MSEKADRRRTFRVPEVVLLKYDVIDEKKFKAGINSWRLRSKGAAGARSKIVDLNCRLDELLFRVGSEMPAVSEVARLLNEKVDIVIQSLPEYQKSKHSLVDQPEQKCELSSEGMLFGTNEILRVDTKLVVRFLVIPDNRYFEMFASVARFIEMTDEKMGPYDHLTAVRFHGMSAAEREDLIHHLFNKQSETLRLRRINAENAE